MALPPPTLLAELLRPVNSAWARMTEQQQALAIVQAWKTRAAMMPRSERELGEHQDFLHQARAALWDGTFIGPVQSPETYEAISTTIAANIPNLRRVFKSQQELVRKHALPHYLDLRAGNDRLIKMVEAIAIDASEFAVFLRARRVDADPESRGGPTFDNPEDLESYLSGLISA